MRKIYLFQTFSLTVIALLAGCASEPAPAPQPEPIISGDAMLRESEGMAKLGGRWQEGKNMVERGNALVEEGKAKTAEGQRMIAEGDKIIRESEEQYKGLKK